MFYQGKTVIYILLLLAIMMAKPALAQEGVEDDAHYALLLKESSDILGHISMANIALLHDMYPEGIANVKLALKEARALEMQVAEFNSAQQLRFARISYTSQKGEHSYWIPVVNNALAVRTMDGDFIKSRKPDVVVSDARIVHYNVLLNTQHVRDQLEKADVALKRKEYDKAEQALELASQAMYRDAEVQDQPLEAIHDNLMLARDLADDKNYTGAAYALEHAKQDLEQFKRSSPDEDVKELGQEIAALDATLNQQQHPGMTQVVKQWVAEWME